MARRHGEVALWHGVQGGERDEVLAEALCSLAEANLSQSPVEEAGAAVEATLREALQLGGSTHPEPLQVPLLPSATADRQPFPHRGPCTLRKRSLSAWRLQCFLSGWQRQSLVLQSCLSGTVPSRLINPAPGRGGTTYGFTEK